MSSVAVDDIERCFFPNLNDGQPTDDQVKYLPIIPEYGKVAAFCNAHSIPISAFVHVSWTIALARYTGVGSPCFGIVENQSDLQVFALHLQDESNIAGISKDLASKKEGAGIHVLSWPIAARVCNTAVLVREGQESSSLPKDPTVLKSLEEKFKAKFDVLLIVTTSAIGATLELEYKSSHLSSSQACNLQQTLAQLLTDMALSPDLRVGEVWPLSERDRQQILNWNSAPLSTSYVCVHNVISARAEARPNAEALCTSDGSVSYAEFEMLTNRVACYLLAQGIPKHSKIPFCIERSSLVLIAMVGILKAGAAFVPLTPDQPMDRIRLLVGEVEAPLIVTSPAHAEKLSSVAPLAILSGDVLEKILVDMSLLHGLATPDDLAYVLFTSGSTGKPKGVLMEHKASCSSSFGYLRVLNMNEKSRVFQFATYTFDACIFETLSTLMGGGCVCIPSEHDRMNDVEGSMQRLRANTAFLTPTTGSFLNPQATGLDMVVTGGEAVPRQFIQDWAESVHLVQCYGPTETAVFITLQLGLTQDAIPNNIGKSTWAHIFLVDLKDPRRLAPVGAIGEIIIEGPGLARGYLNNPTATDAAFIEIPSWFDSKKMVRCYRTGDLARYGSDGCIHILGRKDTQAKLRGQRMELGEVEHHLSLCVPEGITTAAVIISSSESLYPPKLVGFLQSKETNLDTTLIPRIESALSQKLPSYMVPSDFLTLPKFPIAISSGKLDRKTMRQIGDEMLRKKQKQQSSCRPPSTPMEVTLQGLWAKVLCLGDCSSIGAESDFIRVGGDSIHAMKLVAAARSHGVSLTVKDVLSNPKLCEMASKAITGEAKKSSKLAPFALLDAKYVADIKSKAALACEVTEDAIEDIYPCTPLQEGFMAVSYRQKGAYVGQYVFSVSDTVPTNAAIAAWEEVYAATPALRTRIISTSDDKALQVVIRGTIDWQRSDDLGLYLSTEDLSMQLGEPLSRHAIILDKRSGAISIVCTLHHAIYDGWTLKLLEERLHQAYAGQTFVPDQFSNFIQFTQNLEAAPMVEFWKKYLCGVKKTCYPAIAQPGYVPKPQSSRRHKIQLGYLGSMGVTASSLIQVAWAILLARLTEEEEVVIGTTLTGRTVDLDGVEDLAGPTITTVPVRVRLHEYVAANPGETVKNKRSRPLKEVLTEMQEYSKTVIPHQHFGLQNIQSLSEDIRKACDFHSLLVVQPQNQKGPNKLFTGKYANDNMDGLHTYGLLFSCELTDSGVNVLASYDQNLVHGDHVSRLLFQLDHILQQMCNGRDMTVDDLVLVSPQDEKEIGVWNANITEPINDCVHNMIKRNRDRSPKNPAVNSWDGNLTYDELIQVSARLAVELVQRGVGPETIVPLAFDKSMWTIVAVLGVLQAGGAFVLLDMALPIERIKLIIRKVSAKVVVAGRSSLHKLTVPETFILDDNTVPSLPESTAILDDVKVAPNNAAYVMFTSGSTGEPKGCVLEHGSFCTSGWGQGKAFGMTPSTRSLQFASYSFAASIIEILTTMIHGGCVCVLSDEERMNNISNAIREREANWAFLTPSLLSVLDPNVVPSLKALSIGGEAIRAAQIVEWADRVDLQHGYGNAECCGVVCTNSLNKTSDTKDIGHAYTGRCWIVEPDNVHKLTPVGCVGEIVIEGRIVGRGYMNEPAKTAAAFISAPEWRSRFGAIPPNTSFYRTGDLGRYGATGGMLQYMGRKDTQIKYHGQRIELGEIEYHVKRSAPEWAETIVELVIPQNGTKDSAVLAVFIALKDRYDGPEDLKNLSDITKSMTTGIAKAITNGITGSVPEYMIPSVFIPLKKMPMTLSGKTYRKSLREIGAGLTIREMKSIVGTQKSTTVVTNQQEKVLQKSWAAVLELDENEISLQDSFFSLGGDSLSAMRLVAACRNGGISLTVKDIFHFPKLRDMAKRCAVVKDAKVNRLPPFKLLGNDRDAIVEAVLAAITDHTRNEIQDIYPALPAQKETLITSSRVPGAYMAQFSLTLPHDANIRKFQLAWDKTVAMNEILRTRIVDTESFGCMQVVSSHTPEWVITTDLDNYLKQDQALGMTFGSALCRSAIFQDPKTSCSIVVISLHHALYDGWSLPALLTTLSNNYQGRKNQPSLGFNEYIDMLQQQDKTEACNFWKSYLAGAPATRFPNVPKSHVFVDSKVEYELPSGKPAVAGVTVSTVLRVAWALLLAQYTAEDDVVFGSVHAARNIDIPGIERMIAPTVTCVPVRARFEPEQLVISLLSTFQEQTTAMMPFEYLGWSEIQSLNADATAACNFNNLFVVHPGDNKAQLDGFTCSEFSHDMNKFYIHPLTVECEFFDEKPVKATVHFDSKIMSHRQVERLLYQLECILHQVWNADDKLQVKNLQVSCTEDILDIINWNSAFKPLSEEIIHLAQEQQKNLSQKDNYRTWIVNPRNPNQLAGVGAIGELLIEQADDKSKAYSRKNQFWPTNSPLHMGPLMTTCLLARYNEDGSVFYVDKVRMSDNTKTQLRELEEVSSQVERSLPRHIKHAVKIVSLSRKNVLTVVFVSLESGTGSLTPAFLAADSPENYAIREKIKFGVERLRASIPSFKFPRLVPISHIPVLATGGVDYSVLEKIGVMITESHFLDLNNLEVVQSRQLTSAEDAMVHLWAQVLDMQSDLIGHQDDFLQLGGDSVKAMRLVAAARKAGYSLTVRDIYKTPSLSDMARIVKPVVNNTAPKAQTVITREPTPTATKEVSAATKVPAATLSRMGISETEIEDVVPCLPFQKRMLCSSLLENRGLIYYISIDLPSTIDIVRLMSACTKVVARHSILRTIFVQGQDNEVLQVIHKTSAVDIHLEEANGNLMHASERFITEDKKSCAVFDQPITRFILLRDLQQKTSRFMIRLSHAQFDGYSLPILWHDLQSAYAGNVFSSPSTKFGDFVRSVQAVDASSSRIFWEKTLGKTKMSQLVQHDTPSISNHMDTLIPRRIPRAVWDQTGYQPSYVLKTAWAMVLGELLHTSDVIFGEVISNRNVNMERVETVLGPCVNVVPVRVQMDHGTIRDILTSIKDQSIARIPYESASFQQTMSRSTDHPHWMRFSSVVVHQDIEVLRDADKAMSLKFDGEVSGITWVEPQWDMADLAVVSKPDQDNIIIHVNFSRQLIPEDLALTILDRLESCISSLAQRMDDSLTPTKGVMNGLMPPFPLRQEKVVVDTPKADANVQRKVHQAWKTVFPSNRLTLPSGNRAEDANFLEFGGIL
ncbi:nonribosomal peptide synthase [Aspergillus sclerotialis]|uniref:Nonribosomal peptide synthase n=1 Tax=Aspergillus sclerotialis TaxID=2070753 RepID=A0A3A2ZRK2_9EURO|nr:nonribosomal peptide synthase [Aspergillus sclerotialis]